jgi:uncharacterized protein (TIGR02145 family)
MLLRIAIDGDNPTARYRSRVVADGGTLSNYGDVQKIVQMLRSSGRFNQVKFLWYGGAGVKLRTSGVNSFVSKAYSVQLPANDLAQTTELSQPWQSGNIAPNEKPCLLNPNGGARFMSHPAISFGATEAWSISLLINWNGTNLTIAELLGSVSNATSIYLRRSSTNRFGATFTGGTGGVTGANSTLGLVGKNKLINFVYTGSKIDMYFDGAAYDSITINGAAVFEKVLQGCLGTNHYGKLHYYLIQSSALTASQVSAEYNTLKSLIPDVETVLIGSKYVASSNLDVICSANGTVIPDGTVSATWDDGTSAWCYPKDATPSEVYLGGKLYNKAARNVIIANPPAGYHVATEAELTAIAALGANALKLAGTTYWATTGGANTTGFTALGMASRKADGSFNTYKNTASFWCADSDKVLILSHDSNTASVEAVASVNDGHSIRLIKD